ncbi:GIY-YIG nuclease family protein [Deinococcus multiflagellatus]|uniref:GIY-YIG nuclease family protein n=1 Tax=Deinococcus multiflagellatus TaxID=1656887 RepID=A0ABW1ZPI2_9DEIO|nr:GIY-YIG nuclease family protein [Deinococcus multiflagellatus]MBZ9714797.1 GIY-YIG nuclease family protein [Deinococcus multiflagellatus]
MAKVSGIYAIVHRESGKVYIGSAVDIASRWRLHRKQLQDGTHHAVQLQRAWRKYGPLTFEWRVLEQCPAPELLALEQTYLDSMPEAEKYNSSPTARSPLGTKHRPEVVEAMRQRVIAAYADPVFRAKHREAQKRRFADPAQKDVIRKRNSGLYRVTSPAGEVMEVEGMTRFCKERGLSSTRMLALARGHSSKKDFKGWKVEELRPSRSGLGRRTGSLPALPNNPRGWRNQKAFVARAPDGRTLEGVGLAAFARQTGLSEEGLRNVAARRNAHCGGWVIRWKNDYQGESDLLIPTRGRGMVRRYLLTSPTGEVHRTDNLSGFAAQHGLNAPTLVEVARGRRNHHHRWRCIYDDQETAGMGQNLPADRAVVRQSFS